MPNPFPELRHLSTCPSRPLWVGVAAIALIAATSIAGDPADDDFDEDAAQSQRDVEVADATVYVWVFGKGSNAADARRQLETVLRQKAAIVDRVCGLTDVQKQKLQLAGRGDIKRFFNRVQKIETEYLLVKNDADRVKSLGNEAQLLQRGLVSPGMSKPETMFVKSLEQLLTAEQAIKYAPLRAIFREGGLITTWPSAPAEVLGINLSGTAINDDDLVHLSDLSRLSSLGLNGTKVTDAGLVHLGGVANLQTLTLHDTQVADGGLVHLKGLTKLEWLAISSTQVTDTGLEHLNDMTGLQGLLLGKTQVTDAGLMQLKRLTKLQMLGLDDTRVTDEGLAHLNGLTSLQQLSLGNTQVTDAGVADLKKVIPKLTIRK